MISTIFAFLGGTAVLKWLAAAGVAALTFVGLLARAKATGKKIERLEAKELDHARADKIRDAVAAARRVGVHDDRDDRGYRD